MYLVGSLQHCSALTLRLFSRAAFGKNRVAIEESKASMAADESEYTESTLHEIQSKLEKLGVSTDRRLQLVGRIMEEFRASNQSSNRIVVEKMDEFQESVDKLIKHMVEDETGRHEDPSMSETPMGLPDQGKPSALDQSTNASDPSVHLPGVMRR